MCINFLLDVFKTNSNKDAIIWKDEIYSYNWLIKSIQKWTGRLDSEAIHPASVVALEGDFSPNSISLILALIERKCIIVPLTKLVKAQKAEFYKIAQVENVIKVSENDSVYFQKLSDHASHELLLELKALKHPGLIFFSSGSTGKSKAAVHDFFPFLEKFKVPRYTKRTILFLLFDHIGGIDTLFYTLSNGGCMVVVPSRSVKAICKAIEQYKVQVLPVSPTFIHLFLMGKTYQEHDLTSLEIVTYGAEVMPESTLQRFHTLFPNVRMLQKYGLSELGILRSKSKSSNSLWVKVGGEGFNLRVVDGLLEIKARSAMQGYLNAPNPFTEDGWFKTGDAVEVDKEYIRILGRKSEIINVGGEKVYPAEVENVIQMMNAVEDVVVSGEKHLITGQMVVAKVRINSQEPISDFRKRMRLFCKDKLPNFKVPQKVILEDKKMYSKRFKKIR